MNHSCINLRSCGLFFAPSLEMKVAIFIIAIMESGSKEVLMQL